MQELYYWIALRFICGVGNVNYKKLVEHFGSAEKILNANDRELRGVEGLNERARQAILNFKPGSEIDREIELIEKKSITVLTLSSPQYPANLKNIYDPPSLIYVKGKIEHV